jgi:hypothetical protein
MAYTASPATSVTDRLRLNVGDIHSVEILDDETYTYYYNKNEQNERRATRDLFTVLLFALSRYTHEKAGQLEVWGSDYFRNYLDAVKLAITNPSIDSITAVPFAGGISRTDMDERASDTDAVDKPFYIGCTNGRPAYLDKTVFVPTNLQTL